MTLLIVLTKGSPHIPISPSPPSPYPSISSTRQEKIRGPDPLFSLSSLASLCSRVCTLVELPVYAKVSHDIAQCASFNTQYTISDLPQD